MANLQHIKHPANKSSASNKRKHQKPNDAVMISNIKKIKPTHYGKEELVVKPADEYSDEVKEDRLTNLPEPIQLHILSLLSLKQAAQTSMLSKSWVSLWTLIPVLKIDSYDFVTYRDSDFVTYRLSDFVNRLSDFDKIVTKILACRDNSVKLNKLVFNHYASSSAKIWKTVFGYAFSHGVKEVKASIMGEENGSWSDCLHNTSSDSLTRLKLISDTKIRCQFLGQKSAGLFKNLTNLYLQEAIITDPDSFSGFPALEKLTLNHCCYKENNLNVHTSQLSALTIKCSYTRRLNRCELSTPKLRIFRFRTVRTFAVFVTPQALPVLDEVVFDYQGFFFGSPVKHSLQDIISMFRAFHNAKCLTISESFVRLLSSFPTKSMMRCSQFRGLKFLKLEQDGSGEIPRCVKDYLLQYSADAKISMVKINKW